MSVLGLDIGGANIKAAFANGTAKVFPFELWKQPERLSSELSGVFQDLQPAGTLAVTMTAELCDCFATKREGVAAILDAVITAAAHRRVVVWSTTGQFLEAGAGLKDPLKVAAGNWHALATFAGRFALGSALLIDVGSTTTDIVPLQSGKPAGQVFSDYDRLRASQLVYTGVRRTPVCALLGPEVMAELFATTLDAYLMLGDIGEKPANHMTADGRPATRKDAHARLARMLGADSDTCSVEETTRLAGRVAARQEQILNAALHRVASTLPAPPATIILAGSGEFLAARVLGKEFASADVIALSAKLGIAISHAACAYAVAVLAEELGP